MCPYAKLDVATNTPVGRHAGRAAQRLADASSALAAAAGVERPFAEAALKIRSVALLHLSTINTF